MSGKDRKQHGHCQPETDVNVSKDQIDQEPHKLLTRGSYPGAEKACAAYRDSCAEDHDSDKRT